MAQVEFDQRDFRRALGKFPTGVTIITTRTKEGTPIGVTASSFNSVSVDPPLVLWSVDKGSFSSSIFKEAEFFAVNVLDREQVSMSNQFAGRSDDKFAGIDYKDSPQGAPLFNDCSAQFECKTWNVYEGGDHYIIVGEVLDYSYQEAKSPLVFAEGSYAVSMQHPSSAPTEVKPTAGEGFLGNYLLYWLRVAYTNFSAELYPQLLERFQITPEEWRVLSLLADHGHIESSDAANVVGQPLDNFKITSASMSEKGWLSSNQETLSLSEQGLSLAQEVLELARNHEGDFLSELSKEQREELKTGLRLIAEKTAK